MSNKTKKVVSEMMKENTGTHFLDSGNHYGRHWEKNQKVNSFEDQEVMELEVYEDEVLITYNIYHYLTSHLEFCENMQKKFNNYLKHHEDKNYLQTMKDFGKYKGYDVTSMNSYNRECILSQTIQYVLFKGDDGIYNTEYIALQLHNGCDVRGGYTKPRIFIPKEIDYFLIAQTDVSAVVKDIGLYSNSDDAGYSWHGDFDVYGDKTNFYPEKNKVTYLVEHPEGNTEKDIKFCVINDF